MASVSINDVLGGPNLCGVIQATTSGIPKVLPQGFYEKGQDVDGDTGEYKKITGTRTAARISAYGSPSQQRQLRDVTSVPVKLLHTIEHIQLKPTDYMNLLNYDDLSKQKKGIAEVTRQVKEFRKNFDNLRVAALTQALALGAIYFDGLGNLLPSSTGAKTTVDFGVPAGNKTQLNVDGSGNVLTVGWQTASTDIATQIMTLRQKAEQVTGYELKHAFYGRKVPGYLVNNNTLQGFFVRNQEANPEFLRTADIPSPLLGLQWHPAYTSFYEDSTGTNQTIFGDDTVVFTPDPSPDWFEWLEGSYPVPRNIGGVSNDAVEALGDVEIVNGDFSYATVIADPVTVKMVAGDTFLPVIKVPKAVFIATVNF